MAQPATRARARKPRRPARHRQQGETSARSSGGAPEPGRPSSSCPPASTCCGPASSSPSSSSPLCSLLRPTSGPSVGCVNQSRVALRFVGRSSRIGAAQYQRSSVVSCRCRVPAGSRRRALGSAIASHRRADHRRGLGAPRRACAASASGSQIARGGAGYMQPETGMPVRRPWRGEAQERPRACGPRGCSGGRVERAHHPPLGLVADERGDGLRHDGPSREDQPLGEPASAGSANGALELVVGQRWRHPEQSPGARSTVSARGCAGAALAGSRAA